MKGKEKDEKALAVVGQGPSALAIPEYLKGAQGDQRGMEEVERGDINMPRITICQSLTPQKKRTNPLCIDGLEEGELFNTVSGQVYGVTLKVIPVMFFKQRIKFFPLDQGGGIDCQSLNAKTGGHHSPDSCERCQFSRWEEEKPECMLFHNRLVLVLPTMEKAVISMKGTGLKPSKQWNAMARMTGLPLFARIYDLATVPETRAGNEYYQWAIRPGPFVDQDFFRKAEAFFEQVRGQGIQVDTRGEAEEVHEARAEQPSM